jgi:hypothetical protein
LLTDEGAFIAYSLSALTFQAEVPEPSTLLLAAACAAPLLSRRRRAMR